MKKISSLLVVAIATIFVASCEKDFNGIGQDLINQVGFQTELKSDASISTEQINFYDQTPPTGLVKSVETGNLPYNLLGYYNDPTYGSTTANVVTQVGLSQYDIDIDYSNPELKIKKVILSVPYFSTLLASDATTNTNSYQLDSIYGSTPIDLKIYRSNYFLNNFEEGDNGDFNQVRRYYANEQEDLFGPTIAPNTGNVLEQLYHEASFTPSNLEVPVDPTADPVVNLTPRLYYTLTDTEDNNFDWLIDPANETAIFNASNFTDFYRGLLFVAESTNPAEGTLLSLDLSQAAFEITYEYQQKDIDGNYVTDDSGDPVLEENTINMTMTGRKVNFFNNNFNSLNTPNRLYIKGGEGAMATINLFGPESPTEEGVFPELETIRAQASQEQWLINEANLEFYVDNTSLTDEPERLLIYDFDNNAVLLDYNTDTSLDKSKHIGKLITDTSGKGIKYQLSITDHIKNVIKEDSTNIQLGLIITNNVLATENSQLSTTYAQIDNTEDTDGNSDFVYSSSVIAHRGTILYDENAIDEDKRLKLKIYYTRKED